MQKLRTLLRQHLRIGFVSFLIVLDLAILAIAAVDVRRFSNLGFDWHLALDSTSWRADKAAILEVVLFFIFLLAILPASLGVFRVLFGSRRHFGNILALRHWSIVIAHVFIALLLSGSLLVLYRFQRLAGIEVSSRGGVAFNFNPFLFYITDSGRFLWVSLLSAAGAIAINVLYDYMKDGSLASWPKTYATRTLLVDLEPSLYPVHGRGRANFNASALGPEIWRIKKSADKSMRQFQEAVPASLDGRRLLSEWRHECEESLRGILIGTDKFDGEIMLFPGTSRALEVAIMRRPGAKRIIFSPLEHKSERAVGDWCSHISSEQVSVATIALRIEDDSEWSSVKARLSQEFMREISNAINDGLMPVIILSEVWWATGLIIPACDIVSDLREHWGGRVHIVIDGAHIPGNVDRYDAMACADSYILSAHKWLFSAEPCGILIERSPYGASPYDAWGLEFPATTAGGRLLAHLRASLELISSPEWPELKERSRQLRHELLRRIEGMFLIVGASMNLEESLMVALRPAKSYQWRFGREGLETHFGEGRVSVTIVGRSATEISVRLAFPYFLELRDVERAQKILKNAIELQRADGHNGETVDE